MSAKLGVVSVVQAMINDLRSRIFEGDLTPGTPLGEVDVAAHYTVARPTAKAAIENLVASGLLTRNAHQSARVTVLGAADARDIYQTRAIIEAEAVRLLSSTGHVPQAAHEANAQITALTDASPIDLVKPDLRFHSALVNALNSRRTSAIYAQLSDEIRLCMTHVQDATLLSNTDIAAEHQRLLDQIQARDAPGAVQTLTKHLNRASKRLEEHLDHISQTRA